MKRCSTCNRTYTDESLMFCADDGTRLVEAPPAPSEPFNAPAASQPTIAASAPYTPPPPPPPSSYQPSPKRRIWLALIALAFGLFAVPFLLYSLSQPIFWEYAYRNLRVDRLFISSWGGVTLFGTFLVILSVIAALVAIILSIKKPAQYGGRLVALIGPVLGVVLIALVVGAFAFRRIQGPIYIDVASSNSNYNSNYNSNRSDNYNSASNSNSDSNSNSSDSPSEATESTSMSERDKYRLFYAAAKSGDTSLQQRAATKVGIVDSNGMPSSTYQSFTKGMLNWAFTDRAWVQTMDTPDKARAYAQERL